MTTAIGIMDREGWEHRTDILVVVDPDKKEVYGSQGIFIVKSIPTE